MISNKPLQTIKITRITENHGQSTHPVRPVVKLSIPQRNVTLEQTQPKTAFTEQTTGRTKSGPTKNNQNSSELNL